MPRPLEGRALENVAAFARLVGYVRYFHPSLTAVQMDWDDFTELGVREVEDAPDAGALAATLADRVRAFAPAVELATSSAGLRPLPAPPALPTTEPAAVMHWRHVGVGTGFATKAGPSLYSSVLAREPLGEGVPDPRRPFEADLGAGVVVRMPLARFAGAEDQAASPPPSPASPGGAPWRDRLVRLAAVITAWNAMQHFYPYFDVVRTDWGAALREALGSAAMAADEASFARTLARLAAALHDGHARVDGPWNTGRRWLPVVLESVEGELAVVQVGAGAPPELRAGDVIASIDGRAAADVLKDAEALVSGASPQWIRRRAIEEICRGPADSVVVLGVRSGSAPSDSERPVRLARTAAAPPAEARPRPIAEIAPGIVYVDVDRVENAQLGELFDRLERAHGVVFDFRGYPREVNFATVLARLGREPLRSARMDVPIATRPDRQDVRFDPGGWTIQPSGTPIRAKAVFVIDGRAISQAETMMAIVEQYRLGEIVGETTAGTNGNINVLTLPGGARLIFTGMRVQRQDGGAHHGVGIRPTIPVHRTLRGVVEGHDELLERAVAVASGHS